MQDQLTRFLDRIRGRMHGAVAVLVQGQFFRHGGVVFCWRDVAEFAHALQDVMLAHGGALRIGDGVIGRRRFRQAGQHGRFGDADFGQGLVEINIRRGGKAVGTLAQVNLVHIQFQQLVLAIVLFQLVGEQHLRQLALHGFFARQEKVARHLHGDGAGALCVVTRDDVGERGARQAIEIHGAMLIETRILDGQQGLAHAQGDLLQGQEFAALLAVFGQQLAFAGENAQRQRGLVLCQVLDGRQILPGLAQPPAARQRGCHAQAQGQSQAEFQIARQL